MAGWRSRFPQFIDSDGSFIGSVKITSGTKITIFSAVTPLPAGLAKAAANGATGPDAAARLAGQHAAHRALIPPAGVKHGQKRREDGINDSVNRRVKGRRHCRPSGAPDGGGEEGLWALGLGLLPWAIRLSNVGAGTAGEERRGMRSTHSWL